MPFAVFRRHQRKLLAVFGILAMAAFVLSDTLYRFSSGGYGRNADPVVVSLYGKTYHQSDLRDMSLQRNNANLFMAELIASMGDRARSMPQFFGDLSTRSIVDAIILEHEADNLKMPNGPEVAKEWLKERTQGLMSRDLFEGILRRFNNRVSGTQILTDIASQVRIANARNLLNNPVVTPLDVFRAYRDQNERVSARAVAFPAADYLAKVKDPSASEVEALYEKYKDTLPDDDRETPGFKVPRQVRVEILSIDAPTLAASIKDKLTDAELKAYYENHKSEFETFSELPKDVFADDAKGALTPPLYRPFADVKRSIAISLADEKAQAEVTRRFEKIQEEVIIPFSDKYHDAEDEIVEAKKLGETPKVSLPKYDALKAVAAAEQLDYEISPLLTREQAAHYGQVHDGEVGSTRFSGGRRFVDEFFDAKALLFSPVRLTSPDGRQFLVRKIDDRAPRVPALDEVRDEVVRAWKLERARPLAEKAAEEFAARLKKDGGKIKDEVVEGHKVITTDPVSPKQASIMPGMPFPTGPATPSEIPQIPHASDALREALFDLKPGAVAVAADLPKNVYYVLTENSRKAASFDELYAPNGDYVRFQREVIMAAARQRDEQWMNELRREAGIPKDWVPADAKREAEAE